MPGLGLRLGLGLQRPTTAALISPPPLQISGTPVTTATEGEAYAGFTVSASGGTTPYSYSLVGDWPDGVSVNSSTGEVSGTPTESGTFASLSVRVTDGASDTADLATFTLEVEAASASGDVTYITHAGSQVTSQNVTFSGVDIGAPSTDRVVVVGVVAQRLTAGARTISSVSIGGNAASIIAQVGSTAGGNGITVGIASLLVPSGTTADIAVNLSGTVSGRDIFVWTLTGLDSNTAHDSDTNVNSSGGAASLSLDVPGGGVVIGVATNNGGTEGAFTWSGPTEDFDAAGAEAALGRVSAASIDSLSANASYTVSADSNATARLLVAASFA